MKKLIVMGACLSLAGCVGPSHKLEIVDTKQIPASDLADVTVLPSDYSLGSEDTTVGRLVATSCKNLIWQPDPTEADALAQLKAKAISSNANALIGVEYSKGNTSLSSNCWSTITATATAAIVH